MVLLAAPAPAPPSRRQTPRGYILNDTDLSMALFHNKINRLINGTDTLGAINIIGDSHSDGSGVALFKNGPAGVLARLLQASSGVTVAAHKFGVSGTPAATATRDPRFAFTGTWDAWQALPGGPTFRCTSNAGKMTYNPSAVVATPFDTANLIWFRDTTGNLGGGNMTITVDGGTTLFTTPTSGGAVLTQTIAQVGAQALQSLVITVALGEHTIEVTNGATGNIEIFGFEVYKVATPTLLIRSMGYSSQSSVNYVANSIPTRIYDTPLLCQLQIFCLGANDGFNAVSLATYAANLATLKTSLTVSGTANVLAWPWPPSSAATLAYATQQPYIDTFKAAFSTNMIYDQYQRYIDRGKQEALSAGGFYKDGIHLNDFATIDVMTGIHNAIMPLGV